MNPSSSIGTKTMKTSSLLPLFATFTFVGMLIDAAHAGGISADTRHGGTTSRICIASGHSNSSDTSSARVSNEYAKFLWLCSTDDSQVKVNRIVVSLADQRLYAYRDRQLVAWSNVSSGRPGHETPTGLFTVSEKDADHHSNLYDNAPMPYFMRLTDGGVGLHAGQLPGYPASHGCVRLPAAMARELYQHVESGTSVEITGTSVGATMAQNASPVTSLHLAQQ